MTARVTSLPARSAASRARDVATDVPPGTADKGAPLACLNDVLAPYAHVANCPACRSYAVEGLAAFSPTTVLSATLAHHESAHRCDPLSAASEHFGLDTSP